MCKKNYLSVDWHAKEQDHFLLPHFKKVADPCTRPFSPTRLEAKDIEHLCWIGMGGRGYVGWLLRPTY